MLFPFQVPGFYIMRHPIDLSTAGAWKSPTQKHNAALTTSTYIDIMKAPVKCLQLIDKDER